MKATDAKGETQPEREQPEEEEEEPAQEERRDLRGPARDAEPGAHREGGAVVDEAGHAAEGTGDHGHRRHGREAE